MLRFFLLATLLIAVGVVVFFFFLLFKIRNVEISPNQTCLTKEAVFEAAQVKGSHLLLISKKKLIQNLKEKYVCLKSLNVYRRLPSTLAVEVEVDKTLVKIENTNLFLTEQGLVVGDQSAKDLPILYPGRALTLSSGEKINDELISFTLKVVQAIEKSDFVPVNIRIIDDVNVAFYNQQGLVVIFSPKKDATFQVDSLQQVLAKAKIDGTKIAKIDLRFDKPVIVNK